MNGEGRMSEAGTDLSDTVGVKLPAALLGFENAVNRIPNSVTIPSTRTKSHTN